MHNEPEEVSESSPYHHAWRYLCETIVPVVRKGGGQDFLWQMRRKPGWTKIVEDMKWFIHDMRSIPKMGEQLDRLAKEMGEEIRKTTKKEPNMLENLSIASAYLAEYGTPEEQQEWQQRFVEIMKRLEGLMAIESRRDFVRNLLQTTGTAIVLALTVKVIADPDPDPPTYEPRLWKKLGGMSDLKEKMYYLGTEVQICQERLQQTGDRGVFERKIHVIGRIVEEIVAQELPALPAADDDIRSVLNVTEGLRNATIRTKEHDHQKVKPDLKINSEKDDEYICSVYLDGIRRIERGIIEVGREGIKGNKKSNLGESYNALLKACDKDINTFERCMKAAIKNKEDDMTQSTQEKVRWAYKRLASLNLCRLWLLRASEEGVRLASDDPLDNARARARFIDMHYEYCNRMIAVRRW